MARRNSVSASAFVENPLRRRGSFEQSYNAQIAVDSEAQIIVAASLTQEVNDKQQLVPMLTTVKENLGQLPEKATADAGYFSAAAVTNEASAASIFM